MQLLSGPTLSVCKMGTYFHAGLSLGFRVPKGTRAYRVRCGFFVCVWMYQEGDCLQGLQKNPIASLENRRQGSYSRPPLDVLGEPQGSSPPHREEGPAGAGRLNGLWWS